MQKLDLDTLRQIAGGGYGHGGGTSINNSANNGGIAIQGNGNNVYAGNTSNQSSNSGSSKKS